MCELIPKAKVKLLLRVILAVNIILTYSRSAWLGLFLSVLFYGILNRKQVAAILKKYDPWKISFICFGGIAVVLLLIILSGRAEDFLQRFRFDMKNEAFNIRLTYARAFLQYLLQGPPILKVLFGHGVATSGAFIQTVPEYMSFKNGFYQYFDNSYITMVYEFGIVPALIFVCFIVSLIRKVLKRHRGTPYLLAFIASAVAFFFYDARIYVDVTFPAIVCVFLGLTGSGENHG